MNPMQTEIARAMFRLAWADGQIQQQEVDLISGLLQRLGIPLAERLAAMDEALSTPYDQLPELDAVLPDRSARLAVLRQLIALSFVDGQVHTHEAQILANLSTRWEISADELEQLRLQVGG